MEEKLINKAKKNYNPLEEKLSSQIKRIQEILKSGDVPWSRVKSAYNMSQVAMMQLSQDIRGIYPIKQYIKLVQLIFSQFLQYIQDDLEDDASTKIQQKLASKNKSKHLKKQSTEKDIQQYLGSSEKQKQKLKQKLIGNQKQNQKSDILQRYKISNESLVQTQLKKVINSLDSVKTSLVNELIKGQNKRNEYLSSDIKIQLNDMLGEWKQQVSDKYKQLNKWVQQNKIHHLQIIKKKDEQILKLLNYNKVKKLDVHIGTQTETDDKSYGKKLIDQQLEFNMEKERFLRVTKGYQKELIELKKYTKSLRTSSHLKLEEYQKNILDLNKQIKYIKGQFKEYFEGNRQTDDLFLNIYQKHQKTRTPFIPKSDIHQVYQKLKSKEKKQSTIISILGDEEKGELSKKSIKSRDDNSRSKKNKKQPINYNDPLTDVSDLPSKINSFQTGNKLRNSIKAVNKSPSFVLNKQDSLPLIKTLQNGSFNPRIPSSQNIRSLYQSKSANNGNYLSVANTSDNRQVSRITSRKNLGEYKQNISNSLYVQNSSNMLRSPSRGIEEKRLNTRPLIKPLSRQRNTDPNQTLDIRIQRTQLIKLNKQNELDNNQLSKSFNLQNDEHTGNYIIKIKDADQDIIQKKVSNSSHITYHPNHHNNHKSKTVHIHNISSSTLKTPKPQLNPHKQIIYNRQRDNKDTKDKQRQMRTIKQMRQTKQIPSIRKQTKNNTTTFNNIKQSNLINFEKQMSSFFQKYQKIQNYDDYDQDVEDGVEKVKKHHKMVCNKHVCHHMRKFQDKMKKIKLDNINKKPLKLGKLDIKHDTL